MQIKNENEVMPLPNDMDKECIELSNLLNRLPGVRTIESCMGHGKHPYWLFFQCMDINTLSRLSRAVCDRYSDGRWEIMCESGDGDPRGRFWLRTIEILDIDTLNKSIKELMENIEYWFQDEFDDYFENGYKNINGEYVAEQNLDYYANPLSLEQQIKEDEVKDNLVNFDETNAPTEYGKYVDECLNEASKHFFSDGEDAYSVADLFYAGVRCGKSWLEKQGR